MRHMIFALFVMVMASSAWALTANQIVRRVIRAEGIKCPFVTDLYAIGTTDEDTPLIVATCSSGGRFVLALMPPDNVPRFVTGCAAAKVLYDLDCAKP